MKRFIKSKQQIVKRTKRFSSGNNDENVPQHNSSKKKRSVPETDSERSNVASQKKNKKSNIRATCLKLFEDLRKSSCPASERLKIIEKLCSILKGRMSQMILSHDMSRVVQLMVRKGNSWTKALVANEIIANCSELAKKKYSNHVIKALVKHGSTSLKKQIMKTLMKDTISLLTCKNSASLICELYSKHAAPSEKADFRKFIYGDTFRILGGQKNLYSLAEKEPDTAVSALAETKKNLSKLLKKEWCLRYSFVTSVLKDYLNSCPDDDRKEVFEYLKLHVSDLILTSDGCSISLEILWNSTAKEKKAIVKQMQSEFLKLATTKTGSLFILSLFDSVDDTVLMKKIIISKMKDHLLEILENKFGRRMIVYLFLHRDPSFFSPKELEALQEGDSSDNTKKSSEQKLRELRNTFIRSVLINIKDNPESWILNGPSAIITVAVFQHAGDTQLDLKEETQAAFIAIAQLIVQSKNKIKEEGAEIEIFESSCVHKLMKKLIQNDHARHENKLGTFSSCLLSAINKEIMASWLKVNRGCFCLIWMLELAIAPFTKFICKCLKDEYVQEVLKKQETPGSKLLREKLSALKYQS